MARSRTRPKPSRRGAATGADRAPTFLSRIVLRTPEREVPLGSAAADASVNLQRAAMEWTYILRSRERWAGLPSTAERQAERAHELLERLGVDAAALGAIARAGTVEVVMPFKPDAEDWGWEARIFPWEYVIAGATRSIRRGTPLTVMRRLVCGQEPPARIPKPRVLYVQSEPAALRGLYSFETERELVRMHLAPKEPDWKQLDTPTQDELKATVDRFQPDVIHLAGFDTHQGIRLLRTASESRASTSTSSDANTVEASPDGLLDGYLLVKERGRPDAVNAQALGRLLVAGSRKPRLVLFSLWNSGARTAPLSVAAGVAAAVGFQDTFDDAAAELFFATFYATWRQSGWDLTEAFRTACESIRGEPASTGTGVILWSALPLLGPSTPRVAKASGERRKDLHQRLEREQRVVVEPRSVRVESIGDFVDVFIEPVSDLNPSLLHNQQPLFKHFTLSRKQSGRLADVRVKVVLYAGAESATYERALVLDRPSLDLRHDIHVPLTSALLRSVHESVTTSLFVEVAWGDHLLRRETFRVRLLPVDQWRDNARDGRWLPSFIFPRDPAVGRLIDAAQRYVRVLRDDPAAGFDGYQSVDPKAADPTEAIDLQVQAIWSAIVYERGLGYVNPPPSYSSELDSQRLRTPSMIVRDRCGTCIDLSLLLAACLELIDIYPVIFLLEGHAFPGYWRSDCYHEQFIQVATERIEEIMSADSRTSTVAGAQPEPWYLGRASYREIVQQVNLGRLVPVESVRLTENCGFAEAVKAGRANLKVPSEFDAMLDVARAREALVTPLPLWGEQE